MSLILNIDTAVQTSSICIAQDGQVIANSTNPSQKDSASWLHVAIRDLFRQNDLSLHQLEAIAVSSGPGSYTGLRVGMATAKGLCYTLKIPLITINTLKQMAIAAKEVAVEWLCPMIDARRMEVFTAVYDQQLNEMKSYSNMILDSTSFMDVLTLNPICFFGNGMPKFKPLIQHPHAVFREINSDACHMSVISFQMLKNQDIADLAYTEPFYGKDFHSIVKDSY